MSNRISARRKPAQPEAVLRHRDDERKEEIYAVALAVQQHMFAPFMDDRFRLKKGTLLENLRIQGRLKSIHVKAVHRVLYDIDAACGKSGPVTMNWTGVVDKSGWRGREPTSYTNDAYDRLTLLLDEELTSEERAVFTDIFQDYIKALGGKRMAELGFILGGYKDHAQARCFAVSRVTALLERIAKYYRDA